MILSQFLALFQRYLEILTSDGRNLAFLLAQTPIIAIMLWLVGEGNAMVNAAAPYETHKLLFLLACAAVWFGMINAVREIVKEAPIYQRERNVGVSVPGYLASKVAVLALVSSVQIFLLVLFFRFKFDLPAGGAAMPGVLEMYITLLAAAVTGISFGLALSAVTTSADRATSFVPLLLIPQIIFAGLVFKLDGATGVISTIMATRPTLQALTSTAQLTVDAHGRALEGATRQGAYVASRWEELLALTAVGIGLTILFLRAREHEGPFLVRLARALGSR